MSVPFGIIFSLTCINEPPWSSFAELLGFIRQSHFHHSRDVPRRSLHSDGMRSDELKNEQAWKWNTYYRIYHQQYWEPENLSRLLPPGQTGIVTASLNPWKLWIPCSCLSHVSLLPWNFPQPNLSRSFPSYLPSSSPSHLLCPPHPHPCNSYTAMTSHIDLETSTSNLTSIVIFL